MTCGSVSPLPNSYPTSPRLRLVSRTPGQPLTRLKNPGLTGRTNGPPPTPWSPIWLTSTPSPVTSTASRKIEEHTSELQSRGHLVCRLLLEKKKKSKDVDDRSK